MASLVKPRFKTTYIKQERVDYIKTRAAAELQKLVAEQTEAVRLSAPSVTAIGQDEQEEVPAKKKKKSLSSYFKTSAKPSQLELTSLYSSHSTCRSLRFGKSLCSHNSYSFYLKFFGLTLKYSNHCAATLYLKSPCVVFCNQDLFLGAMTEGLYYFCLLLPFKLERFFSLVGFCKN